MWNESLLSTLIPKSREASHTSSRTITIDAGEPKATASRLIRFTNLFQSESQGTTSNGPFWNQLQVRLGTLSAYINIPLPNRYSVLSGAT
jgi:hypothetical protein